LAQHEGVAAEQELVSLLPDFHRRLVDRLAVGADDLDRRMALAVLFDIALDALDDCRILPQLAIRLRRLGLRHCAQHGENGRDGRRRYRPTPRVTPLALHELHSHGLEAALPDRGSTGGGSLRNSNCKRHRRPCVGGTMIGGYKRPSIRHPTQDGSPFCLVKIGRSIETPSDCFGSFTYPGTRAAFASP
jgi:hypothetical protein